MIGTKSDYSQALNKVEWHEALQHGDLNSLQHGDGKDPVIFCQANNTEYLRDIFGQLSAIITCHSTRIGQHQGMED